MDNFDTLWVLLASCMLCDQMDSAEYIRCRKRWDQCQQVRMVEFILGHANQTARADDDDDRGAKGGAP